MNFFELFDIPISFEMDNSLLTKKYYALSRRHHPDNFSLADANVQEDAMDKSAQVNEGYKILKDHGKRMRYVLELYGHAPQEGQDKMPQEFLMDMMELNEALMEVKMDDDPARKSELVTKIESFESDLMTEFQNETSKFNYQTPQSEVLLRIKDVYLKTKYLRRLKDNLNSTEAEI